MERTNGREWGLCRNDATWEGRNIEVAVVVVVVVGSEVFVCTVVVVLLGVAVPVVPITVFVLLLLSVCCTLISSLISSFHYDFRLLPPKFWTTDSMPLLLLRIPAVIRSSLDCKTTHVSVRIIILFYS